jgi:hypothetical protein
MISLLGEMPMGAVAMLDFRDDFEPAADIAGELFGGSQEDEEEEKDEV